MISVNETTWTDRQETVALLDKWDHEGREDLPKPICAFCEHMTTYIVEPIEWVKVWVKDPNEKGKKISKPGAKPKRPGVGFLFSLIGSGKAVLDGDFMYIPDRVCISCIARQDAEKSFNLWQKPYINLNGRCMSESDKKTYRRIFNLKFSDVEKEYLDRKDEGGSKHYRTGGGE